ncbi:MAG: 30S ribosomal protein S20 [bacterium]|nr:30S ribosomal protein S20 [bacterium]MDZ4296617.1 30S ribosomal protein S20 [Patescibacteria group bacterium]
MPILKSAQKALRQAARKRLVNLRVKSGMKDAVKRFQKLLAAKQIDAAKAEVANLYSAIDKAAKRGRVIKKNTAARKKARLMHLLKVAAKG